MVERIERVMHIKRLRFNNDELFQRKKGKSFEELEQGFSSVFKDEVEKKKHNKTKTNPPADDAYHLDVGRPTQSLFYEGKADISDVKGKMPHAG